MPERKPSNYNFNFLARQILRWVGIALVIAMLAMMIIIVRNERNYQQGNDTYAQLIRQVVTTPETTESADDESAESDGRSSESQALTAIPPFSTQLTTNSTSSTSNEANQMDLKRVRSLIDVNFPALKAVNSEVAAWVFSEKTTLSYPIVRSDNNERYLNHLIDGTENPLGTLFIDYRNQPDFRDDNTLIYGHNMEDNSMLASLPDYKRQTYYDDHPVLYLFRPDQTFRVELVSGFDIGPDDMGLMQFNFASPRDHDAFVLQIRTRSWFKSRVVPQSTDRFVTFLTCNYESNEGRFALVGRLVPLGN